MPTFAVTGATGPFGRAAIVALLRRGVAPSDVVAVVRSPERAADLARDGVAVREGDYDRPETLRAALDGVDRVLLVSGNAVGQRVAQHTAVIDAASVGGAQRIAYTSILRADTTENPLAPEHRGTEEVLRASGLAWTLLRNGWYLENFTQRLPQYLAAGEIVGASRDGRIAAATRADYAEAAVVALVEDGHERATYELAGSPFTLDELAATITEVTGTAVTYRDLPPDELVATLTSLGMDEANARFVASLEAAQARGDLDAPDTDLVRLLGRPSTPLAEAIRAAT